MTTVAMGLGSAVAVGDLRILSANISIVRNGLQFSPGTTVFVSSLATLTLAASVLGAGVLGDKFGMKRMFVAGACAAVVFGFIGAAAPNVVVLMIARACIGVAFAFLSGLSLAIMNAVFPPARRAGAIAWYLAAVYAFGVLPATVGSLLAERIGWCSGLLVTPRPRHPGRDDHAALCSGNSEFAPQDRHPGTVAGGRRTPRPDLWHL